MKKTLLAAALALGLSTSSCLGPDHLYDGIKNWNATVTEKDWVNELIFVGMQIIPVYSFALLGDVLIFNTIHYWSGDNPIDAPGEFPGFTKKD